MAGKLAEALVRAGVLAADAYDIEEELGLRKDNSVNLTATLSSGGVEIQTSETGKIIVPSATRKISVGRTFAKKAPIVVWGGESMALSQVTAMQGSPTMTIETYNGKKCLKVVTGAGVVTDIQFTGMLG